MSTGSHLPYRTCIACQKKQLKSKLVRFVARANDVFVDVDQTSPGRGAYTCRNRNCFQAAVKKNAFARAFKRNITLDRERLCLEFDICLEKK